MNQQNLIFEDCRECGEELNDIEKKYCREKLVETNYFYPVCSLCLEKEHDGRWPVNKGLVDINKENEFQVLFFSQKSSTKKR